MRVHIYVRMYMYVCNRTISFPSITPKGPLPLTVP